MHSVKKQKPANQLDEIYKKTVNSLKSIENTICLELSVTERLYKINDTMDRQLERLNSNLQKQLLVV